MANKLNQGDRYATGRVINYYDEKIPFGWHRLKNQRKIGKIQRFDVYYHFRSPCGQKLKFRSKVDIQKFLDSIGETMISSSDFEFGAEAIPFFPTPELQMIDAEERQKSLIIHLEECKKTGAIPFATKKKVQVDKPQTVIQLSQQDLVLPPPLQASQVLRLQQESILPQPLQGSRVFQPQQESVLHQPLQASQVLRPQQESINSQPLQGSRVFQPQQESVLHQPLLGSQGSRPLPDLVLPQPELSQLLTWPKQELPIQQPQQNLSHSRSHLENSRVKEVSLNNCIVISNAGTNWFYDSRVPKGWEKIIENVKDMPPIVRFMEVASRNVFSSRREILQHLLSVHERVLTADHFDFSPRVSPPTDVTGPPVLASQVLPRHDLVKSSQIFNIQNPFDAGSNVIKQEASNHYYSGLGRSFPSGAQLPLMPQDSSGSSSTFSESIANRTEQKRSILTNILEYNVQHGGIDCPVPGTSTSQQMWSGRFSDSSFATLPLETGIARVEEIENVARFAQKRRSGGGANAGSEQTKYRRISSSRTPTVAEDDEVQCLGVLSPIEVRKHSSSVENYSSRKIPLMDFISDKLNFKPHLKNFLPSNVKLTLKTSQAQKVYLIHDDTLPPGWLRQLEATTHNLNIWFQSPERMVLACSNDVLSYMQSGRGDRNVSLKNFDFSPNQTISKSATLLEMFNTGDESNFQCWEWPTDDGTHQSNGHFAHQYSYSSAFGGSMNQHQPEVVDLSDDD